MRGTAGSNEEQHYRYDPLGRRIAAMELASTTITKGRRYIFDGSRVVTERLFYDESSDPYQQTDLERGKSRLERIYVVGSILFCAIDHNGDGDIADGLNNFNEECLWGGGLESLGCSDAAFYYYTDASGRVAALGDSHPDNSHKILEYYRYRAFGEMITLPVVDEPTIIEEEEIPSDGIEDTPTSLTDNNAYMLTLRGTYGSFVGRVSFWGNGYASATTSLSSSTGVQFQQAGEGEGGSSESEDKNSGTGSKENTSKGEEDTTEKAQPEKKKKCKVLDFFYTRKDSRNSSPWHTYNDRQTGNLGTTRTTKSTKGSIPEKDLETNGSYLDFEFYGWAQFENNQKLGHYCSCCEYRQYVRGKWDVGQGPFVNEDGKRTDANEGLVKDGALNDTGVGAEDRSSIHRYGHRDKGVTPDAEYYKNGLCKDSSADAANGCFMKMYDAPGLGKTTRADAKAKGYVYNILFTGQIIDTCNSDKVVAELQFRVKFKDGPNQ